MTVGPAVGLPGAPFLGLNYFEERHEALFFGRDEQLRDVLAKLTTTRFVTVMGSSGTGKSSLIRAAVIPALHSWFLVDIGPAWRSVTVKPGSSPIQNLARALEATFGSQGIEVTLRRGPLGLVDAVLQSERGTRENLLIFVDQFEEIFRYQRDAPDRNAAADEAAAFVQLLLEGTASPATSLFVIATMRSDYLGVCTQFRDFPERTNAGLYQVPRMRRDQLETAITGPAAVAGGMFSGALVQRLLNDAGEDPDQLSVLQHALLQTWLNWTKDPKHPPRIDFEHYEKTGGVRDGLNNHAEEIYNALNPRDREIAAVMFKCLTERDPSSQDIRRPTPVAVVAAVAGVTVDDVIRVARPFRQDDVAFLKPSANENLAADSDLDITHESLIRKWYRLGGSSAGIESSDTSWVQDEADARDQYRDLVKRARASLPDHSVLIGSDLSAATEWRRRQLPFEWAQRYDSDPKDYSALVDYIARSEAARTKRRRRQVAYLTTAVVASLVIAMLAFYSMVLGRRAAVAEAGLLGRTLLARAQALGNADVSRLDRSLLIAIEALRVSASAEAVQEVTDITRQLPRPLALLDHGTAVRAIAVSPSDEFVATLPEGREVLVWRIPSGERVGRYPHDGTVNAVAFSDKSREIATAGADHRVKVWDVLDGKLRAQLVHEDAVNGVAFRPDGQMLASASDDRTVRLWDIADPKSAHEVARLPHEAAVYMVAFSPKGDLLASAGDDGIRLWSVRSTPPRPIGRLACSEAAVSLAFPRDSLNIALGFRRSVNDPPPNLLVAVGYGGELKAWSVPDGRVYGHQSLGARITLAPAFEETLSSILRGPGSASTRLRPQAARPCTAIEEKPSDPELESVTMRLNRLVDRLFRSSADSAKTSGWLVTQSALVSLIANRSVALLWSDVSGGLRPLRDESVLRPLPVIHDHPVISAAIASNQRYMVTGDTGGSAMLWMLPEVDTDASPSTVFSANGQRSGRPGIREVVFADAPFEASTRLPWPSARDASISRADSDRGSITISYDGPQRVAISRDGRWLVAADTSAVITWDLSDAQNPRQSRWSMTDEWRSKTHDARCAAEESLKQKLRVFEMPDRELLIAGPCFLELREPGGKEVWSVPVFGLDGAALSPNGNFVVAWLRNGGVRLWSKGGDKVGRSVNVVGTVRDVVFAPQPLEPGGQGDATFAVCAGGNDTSSRLVGIFDAATGDRRSSVAIDAPCSSVAFDGAGHRIAIGTERGVAHLADVRTAAGMTPAAFPMSAPVSAVTFDNSGRYLAAKTDDGLAHVWDISAQTEVSRFGKSHRVAGIPFSPDGSYRNENRIEFVDSGRLLFTDGLRSPWRPSDVIQEACRHVRRNLTAAEWAEYLPERLGATVPCTIPRNIEPEQ